jgi:hypothetical protein
MKIKSHFILRVFLLAKYLKTTSEGTDVWIAMGSRVGGGGGEWLAEVQSKHKEKEKKKKQIIKSKLDISYVSTF